MFSFFWFFLQHSILYFFFKAELFSSVPQSRLTLCDPMNCSVPGLPVHHQLPESTQTHVHWVGDAIQPSHPLASPSPPAPNLSQHQSLFQWVILWIGLQINCTIFHSMFRVITVSKDRESTYVNSLYYFWQILYCSGNYEITLYDMISPLSRL